MNPAIAFLCRQPNPDGLTVDRVLGMTYSELEHKHDWVQWAFPTWERSHFNPTAPTVTFAEADAAPMEAHVSLHRLAAVYITFLTRTQEWRHLNNHNHLRITRLLKSLRLFGLDVMAQNVAAIAFEASPVTETTRRLWNEALTLEIPRV
jgi:hypothetical protein